MDSHAIDARADLYRVLYRANAILGAHDMEAAIAGVAAIRLLVLDELGEERRRALFGMWDEDQPPAWMRVQFAMARLAGKGIGFAFVQAGMPVEWASRLGHLFDYMVPGGQVVDGEERLAMRDEAIARRDHPTARNIGYDLVAAAMLAGDEAGIRGLAMENPAILARWREEKPGHVADHEVEACRWLRDHAGEIAGWGRHVERRLCA